jgi:hypothetical protein
MPSRQPDETSLGEYPFFLGLNVFFIAFCGIIVLTCQALQLYRKFQFRLITTAQILLAWLAISLLAGSQCCWYLRPFFGPSTIRGTPFILGSEPDYRGASNFYEAVYHIIKPPPLPENYQNFYLDRKQ